MLIYISFGQKHVHSVNGKTFDKDCLAAIKCETWEEGREKAFEYFGDKFFTDYSEAQVTEALKWFPRGVLYVEPQEEEGFDWWGYKHTNGSYQAKRFFDKRDIQDANESPFCERVTSVFKAKNREDALKKVKKMTD